MYNENGVIVKLQHHNKLHVEYHQSKVMHVQYCILGLWCSISYNTSLAKKIKHKDPILDYTALQSTQISPTDSPS